MEKIGNVGWFITNEEYNKLKEAHTILSGIFGDDNLTINYPSPNTTPWVNPADWTWRPWQAPWYGDKINTEPPTWEVGDGEWWKHQPYCSTATNPDVVKESKTNGSCNCECKCKGEEK